MCVSTIVELEGLELGADLALLEKWKRARG